MSICNTLNRFNFVPRLSVTLGLMLAPATLTLSANDGSARLTQDRLSEWIGLEQRISTDKQEWAVEKQIVTSSIEFMEGEIERLQKIITDAEATASAGERKRAELEEDREQLNAVSDLATEAVAIYESKIKDLSTSWPSAFLKMVEVPLKRIPEADQADSAAITMRLQNVIVILSQFDKFNTVVTKSIGVQDIEGTPREVTTLFYGFSFAYFVDGSGSYAGYGTPSLSGNGWEWTTDPGLAAEINELIAVFEQTTEATFIALPAKIATP